MLKNFYKSPIPVLFVIILITFSACQNSSQNETQNSVRKTYDWGNISNKTITIWGDKGDFSRIYVTRAVERYQKLTGNKLELRELSKQEIDELLPQVFSSDTANRPDIYVGYGGTNIENLNPDENFYDFTDAEWIDDLSDTALTHGIYNGRVIGLPAGEASVSGTLYNKEIFQRYQIEIPKTQEEFMNVCATLLKNGVTPVYMPYAEISMLLYQFPMDSILKNENTLNALNDGTLSYSDFPEMKKIVRWYKTMADQGYFGKNYEKNDWNGMDNAMKQGKYGMMLCWDTWIYTNYTGNPEKLGLMPAFMGVPNNGCFEGPNVLLCMVNKKSSNLDAALDFITFLADPYNYNIHYEGIYSAPVFNNQNGSITTPQYMEAEQLINKLFCESIAWNRVRGFSQIDASYIQQYMQGKITLEECIKRMDIARRSRAGIQAKDVGR